MTQGHLFDPPTPASPDGCVYFVRCGDAIKIGHTARPVAERVREMQTGNPERLMLLGTIAADYSREQKLHQRFAAYRIAGDARGGSEWFHDVPMLLAGIEALLAGPWCALVPHPTKPRALIANPQPPPAGWSVSYGNGGYQIVSAFNDASSPWEAWENEWGWIR